MAYQSPYVRLTFGGSIADGEDIWSCGLAIIDPGFTVAPELLFDQVSNLIGAVNTEIEQYVANSDVRVPNNAKHLWTKMALIGTDGKYMQEAVEVQANSGGSQNVFYIPQAAVVNGLMSDKWKDPGKNNRFYLPFGQGTGTNTWKLSVTEQTNYCAQLRIFIESINDALEVIGGTTPPVVGVVSNTGSGSSRIVDSVRIGAIIDTQRRRRNSLPESYVEAKVTY